LLGSYNAIFLLCSGFGLEVADDDAFTKLLSLTGGGLILLSGLAL